MKLYHSQKATLRKEFEERMNKPLSLRKNSQEQLSVTTLSNDSEEKINKTLRKAIMQAMKTITSQTKHFHWLSSAIGMQALNLQAGRHADCEGHWRRRTDQSCLEKCCWELLKWFFLSESGWELLESWEFPCSLSDSCWELLASWEFPSSFSESRWELLEGWDFAGSYWCVVL